MGSLAGCANDYPRRRALRDTCVTQGGEQPSIWSRLADYQWHFDHHQAWNIRLLIDMATADNVSVDHASDGNASEVMSWVPSQPADAGVIVSTNYDLEQVESRLCWAGSCAGALYQMFMTLVASGSMSGVAGSRALPPMLDGSR